MAYMSYGPNMPMIVRTLRKRHRRRAFVRDEIDPNAPEGQTKELVAKYPAGSGSYFLVTDATGVTYLYRVPTTSLDPGDTTPQNTPRPAVQTATGDSARPQDAGAFAAAMNRRNRQVWNVGDE